MSVKGGRHPKKTRTSLREHDKTRKSMRGASRWESPRNAKGPVGSRETRVVMEEVGLQLFRFTGTLMRVIPLKTLLLGCPNQSARVTT